MGFDTLGPAPRMEERTWTWRNGPERGGTDLNEQTLEYAFAAVLLAFAVALLGLRRARWRRLAARPVH